jgi:hypothetical protein
LAHSGQRPEGIEEEFIRSQVLRRIALREEEEEEEEEEKKERENEEKFVTIFKKPASCPYREPKETSPNPPTLFL